MNFKWNFFWKTYKIRQHRRDPYICFDKIFFQSNNSEKNCLTYWAYVRPHLEFAVPAWSPWQEGDKEVLEKVQKRAVKMISGLEGKTYEERLKEVGLLTLEERRHQADMVQT